MIEQLKSRISMHDVNFWLWMFSTSPGDTFLAPKGVIASFWMQSPVRDGHQASLVSRIADEMWIFYDDTNRQQVGEYARES